MNNKQRVEKIFTEVNPEKVFRLAHEMTAIGLSKLSYETLDKISLKVGKLAQKYPKLFAKIKGGK
jgi:hypothetical protein